MSNRKRAIALGFFDGVHLGHAALLRRINEIAAESGALPTVLSFDVHPSAVITGRSEPLICDAVARVDLIRRLHRINDVIFIHFSEETRRMPWDVFAATMRDELSASHLVAGHDFRFGYKGEGNVAKLSDFCAINGIGCDIIPSVAIDGVTVSSTYIRELLISGDVSRANKFLGHPHTLLATVQAGYRLGRSIGAPTINMRFAEGVIVPRYGVYATRVFLEDSEHIAVTNIGVRPTVSGGQTVSAESFILDFDGDLYGREVRVDFYEFIRPEMKFPDVDALKAQIQSDAQTSREYFKSK